MADEETTKPPASVGCCGVRHWQILLHFSFYVIIIAIEMSLSATLPAMLVTNPKLENLTNASISQMFTSFMLAFTATELFGGYICKKFGFRWPMMIFMGVLTAVTLNFATISNEYGVGGIVFCRAVQGVCSGLLYAMPAEAINRWSPIKERTTFGTTVYAGGILGTAMALFMGSYLSSGTNLKYTSIYTTTGYLALIWVVLMAMYGADSPEQYPKEISQVELDYIVNNRGNVTTSKTIPWGKIFTSMPFWAIVVAQIGAGWMFYVLAVNVPIYLRFHYEVNLNHNNLVAVINLITWVLSFAISGIAQLLINENRTSIGQSRKIFNTIGSCVPAIFFLYLSFGLNGNQYVGIALWVIVSVCSVGTICGSRLNCNDITTNFSSIVYGTATWISLLFNEISAIVLNSHFDLWNVVFIYSGILVICTSLFYLKFASGEEQDWNNIYENVGDEEMDLSKSTSRSEVDEKKYLLFIRKQ
ncbi:sialin-like isoform X2 [Harmonia axyridis]|uniref:sialin-like isoform X2 n=1 Tax=Harmonia axyridis TaxID=115357 RepID=UPI001E279ABA|nr:sialin-like isoform X2 [Harmonia axyridis]